MSSLKTLDDLKKEPLKGKKILLRADLNVPFKHGKILDNTRISGVAKTVKELLAEDAKIIIISHFGRPGGVFDSSYSLSPIVDGVSEELSSNSKQKIEVKFGIDCIGNVARNAVDAMQDGEVLILENLRFHKGEKDNDDDFAKELASLADYYVNDAFSCSHRAHASITGVTKFLPSYAGRNLENEIGSLSTALDNPEKPLAAIVGGSKISTKIDVLITLASKADYLIIGGGMANTFFHEQGYKIGASIFEKGQKSTVKKILKIAKENNCEVILPVDTVVAESLDNPEKTESLKIDNISKKKMILDAGSLTIVKWSEVLEKCKTLVWNGPMGAFEYPPFDNSSISMAKLVAYFTKYNKLNSVAGGGDTVAVLSAAGLKDSLSYVSTAGGAFLEWLEGKELSGIKVLKK